MKRILTLFFCICLFFSCKENNVQSNAVITNNKPEEVAAITPLPFKYSYPDAIGEIYTLEDFLKKENIQTNINLDKKFNTNTALNLRDEKYGHPYAGNAHFFKRLPDINKNSVFLFAYWDRETDYKLPTIELQTFDSEGKIIDKMIVVDGINYECSWIRSFEISKEYVLKITDEDICWDIETDKKISDTKKTFTFQINKEGKILDEKPTLDISKWKGTYSSVVNAASEDSRDQFEIELKIADNEVTYTETGYQLYNKYKLDVLDKNGVLFLKYRNTVEGGSAILEQEKNFGTLQKKGSRYIFICPYLNVKENTPESERVMVKK